MGSFSFHKNVAFNPYKGKEPFLPPLSNFTHKSLHYQFCIPIDNKMEEIYQAVFIYKDDKISILKMNIEKCRDELKDIMLNKSFLCSIETGKKIGDLVAIINPLLGNPDAFLAKYMDRHVKAKSSVTDEWTEIQIRLRKINDMYDIEINHAEK